MLLSPLDREKYSLTETAYSSMKKHHLTLRNKVVWAL